MKEKETQAACVLAVRAGNCLSNRNISRMRLYLREDNALVETRKHMISVKFNRYSDHFLVNLFIRRAVSNLRV